MNIKNKKILVTGGAGFIGSNTVNALVDKGANVIVVDNLSTGKKENINNKAKFYNTNIADANIEEIIEKEKPEIVYLFAFYVLVPKSVEHPLLDMDCVVGSLRILNKLKKMKIDKVIFASSGFLYGNTDRLPASESEPIDFITPYVVSKFTVENYIRYFNKACGIPYVILRYAAVYGPGQITGAMADYIRKLSNNQQADIWGNGEKTRDYVFVKDVVKANLMALDVDGNHPNPVFNIGTSKETTLNQLYRKIAEHLNKQAKPIYHPERSGEQIRYCLNNAKIKKELGWGIDYDLDKGLNITLKSWGLIE